MCRVREPISAVLISPLLPDPPVTGGQKRTLRLLEAMARAGLRPQILSADAGADGAADRLRARGWTVEIVPSRTPACWRGRASTPDGSRARACVNSTARFAELASQAALVQFEHTQSAYYQAPPGVVNVLSLHNIDSAVARSAAQDRRGMAARGRTAPRLCASWSGARSRSPTASCASPRRTPRRSARAGGRALLAPNGVDDEFFLSPPATTGERVLFFGHFGYEANVRGLERFLAEGWPEVDARPPAGAARARGRRDERRAARALSATRASTSSASSPISPRCWPPRARWSCRSGRAAGRG